MFHSDMCVFSKYIYSYSCFENVKLIVTIWSHDSTLILNIFHETNRVLWKSYEQTSIVTLFKISPKWELPK